MKLTKFFNIKKNKSLNQKNIKFKWVFQMMNKKVINQDYLDELESGDFEFKTKRLFCLESRSRSGVSSTIRVASKIASSSQPAIAAADLNLGLISEAMFWLFVAVFFRITGLRFCSSLSTIFVAVTLSQTNNVTGSGWFRYDFAVCVREERLTGEEKKTPGFHKKEIYYFPTVELVWMRS